MASKKRYLAIDLGAESGRGVLGTLYQGQLSLSEIQRFTTGPVSVPVRFPTKAPGEDCGLVWDFLRFWQEIKTSIRKANKQTGITAVGVDCWGVDFGLLDSSGGLVAAPYHYRDPRTEGMMAKAFERLPRERIYEITGIQFMPLNTLYQLLALQRQDSPQLAIANTLLMVPDLLNYWLTGLVAAEFTEASTSQILDAHTGQWSQEIIQAMSFPPHLFPDVISPGTILGPLRASLARELGCRPTIVAPPTHDTACAVAAVPAAGDDHVWISSGTWSIVGMNTSEPIINPASYQGNFSNEGGKDGTHCFSKNVMGLWLVQQCRSQWRKEGLNFDYDQLTRLARQAHPLITIVDPDHGDFLKMGDMVERIRTYCLMTQQPIPETPGEIIRAVLEGLALRYRYTIEQLENIAGRTTRAVHIVGGGTKNHLLNQFTAEALNRRVITGPVEATAAGNLMAQAIAMGDIPDWETSASVIKASFNINTYTPVDPAPWTGAYQRFLNNLDKTTRAF